jgi:hypothetical protein
MPPALTAPDVKSLGQSKPITWSAQAGLGKQKRFRWLRVRREAFGTRLDAHGFHGEAVQPRGKDRWRKFDVTGSGAFRSDGLSNLQ